MIKKIEERIEELIDMLPRYVDNPRKKAEVERLIIQNTLLLSRLING